MAEIGWQGIRITVPDDWEPGEFSGDGQSGHIRIDSMMQPRALVRWLAPSATKDVFGKVPTPIQGVDRILDNYIRALTKGERKQKKHIEADTSTRLLSKRKMGQRTVRTYSWRCPSDGRLAHGLVWHCKECGRTIIAEINGHEHEDVAGWAEAILPTVSDHAIDGQVLWAFFDLRVLVPEEFRLENSVMVGGKVELRLENDKREVISAQRWVANVAMRGGDLEAWAKRDLFKPLRQQHTFRYTTDSWFGHPGIRVDGRRKGPKEHLGFMWGRITGRERPFFLDGRIWHCEPANKIHCLHTLARESNRELIDAIQETMRCHPED